MQKYSKRIFAVFFTFNYCRHYTTVKTTVFFTLIHVRDERTLLLLTVEKVCGTLMVIQQIQTDHFMQQCSLIFFDSRNVPPPKITPL